jgi:hypothetical protein
MLARMMRDPDLLTVSQSSARLGGVITTTPTLKRWALQGLIPGSLIAPLTDTVIIPGATVDHPIAPIPTQQLYARLVEEQKRAHDERQRATGYGAQRAA